MNKALAALSFGLAILATQTARAQAPAADELRRETIAFIELSDDPRYEPLRAYERLILKTRGHPFPGAQIGVDEALPLKRVLKTEFALERMSVKSEADFGTAIKAAADKGLHYLLVDAPASAWTDIAAAAKGRDVLLFNVSAPEDTLRRDLCAREVVHAMPSRAQLMDGLVQFLVSKKWRDYLILEGPEPKDAEMTKAFLRSAQKFGARIVAQQKFEPGNDPRNREKNNPALLSAINKDWDVTFVADNAFDFTREISYRTIKPRPVVGSIDLEPVAWSWVWEHNGAPQVNSRFAKFAADRKMESADWAAWISVKMIVQAALRTKSSDFATQRDFILGPGNFDGDKGLAVSVRPWDHQLRQAILLAAPYSIVASAPLEGFLHRLNELDTLGDDQPETPCRLDK